MSHTDNVASEDPRRRGAVRTALLLGGVALAVYLIFIAASMLR